MENPLCTVAKGLGLCFEGSCVYRLWLGQKTASLVCQISAESLVHVGQWLEVLHLEGA